MLEISRSTVSLILDKKNFTTRYYDSDGIQSANR